MSENVGAVKTKNIASIGFDLATGLNQLQTLRDAVNEASADIQSKLHIKLPEGDVTLSEKQITRIAEFRAKQDVKYQVQIETNRVKSEQRVSEFVKKNQIELDTWRTKQYEKQLAYERAMEEQSLQQSNSGFKSMMANRLGWIAASTIYREVGDFFSETVEATKDVEMRMVAINRVMSDSAFTVDEYREKLIQLAKDLGTNFEQVSDVYLEWARAGYSASDALEATRVSILGMNTQQLASEEVTTKMIGIMAQWGMEANDMADILDKVAKMADVTALDASGLVEMLVRSSSAAKNAGISFDEMVALLTTMKVESGRTANVVGTAANSMMVYLSRTANAEKLAALGVDFYTDETRSQMRPLLEIIKDLSVVWRNNQEASESFFESMITDMQTAEELTSEEAESLRTLVGTRNQNIFLALLDGMDEYESKLSDIAQATDYSQSLQEKYMDTLQAKQEQLNSTILELQIAIADAGLYDILESFIKFGSGAVASVSEIVDAFGLIPTATTAAALGLSLFGKNLKLVETSSNGIALSINTKLKKAVDNVVASSKSMAIQFKTERNLWLDSSFMPVSKTAATAAAAFNTLRQNILSSSAAMKVLGIAAKSTGYVINTVFTMGIGLIVGEIMNGIVELWEYIKDTEAISRENAEKLIEDAKDIADAAKEQAEAFADTIKTYDELILKYEEAKKAQEEGKTVENDITAIAKDLLSLQEKINERLSEATDYVDLVNGSYDEQKQKLLDIMVAEQAIANQKAKEAQSAIYAKYDIGIQSETSAPWKGKYKFELTGEKGFEEQLTEALKLYEDIAYLSAAGDKEKKAALEMIEIIKKDLEEYKSYDIVSGTTNSLKSVLGALEYSSAESIEQMVRENAGLLGLKEEQILIVVDALVKYQEGLNAATGITNEFENEALKTINTLDEFKESLNGVQDGVDKVFNAIKKLADGSMPTFDEWIEIFDEYPEIAEEFVKANGDMSKALDGLFDKLQSEQQSEIGSKIEEIKSKLYNEDGTEKEGIRESTKERLKGELAFFEALSKLITENYEKEKYYAEKITDLKIDELNKQKNALKESYEEEDKEREKAELRARGDYESMQRLAEIKREEERERELAKFDEAIQSEKDKLAYAIATGDYSFLNDTAIEDFATIYENYMSSANNKILEEFGLDLKTMLDSLKTEYGLKIVNFTIEQQNNYNETDTDLGASFADSVIEGISAAGGN